MINYNSTMALRNQSSGYQVTKAKGWKKQKANTNARAISNTSREKLLYFVVVIIFVALSVTIITGFAVIAESNYQLQQLSQSIEVLAQENTYLDMEITKLRSPERIMGIAQQELGMTLDNDRIIVLSNY